MWSDLAADYGAGPRVSAHPLQHVSAPDDTGRIAHSEPGGIGSNPRAAWIDVAQQWAVVMGGRTLVGSCMRKRRYATWQRADRVARHWTSKGSPQRAVWLTDPTRSDLHVAVQDGIGFYLSRSAVTRGWSLIILRLADPSKPHGLGLGTYLQTHRARLSDTDSEDSRTWDLWYAKQWATAIITKHLNAPQPGHSMNTARPVFSPDFDLDPFDADQWYCDGCHLWHDDHVPTGFWNGRAFCPDSEPDIDPNTTPGDSMSPDTHLALVLATQLASCVGHATRFVAKTDDPANRRTIALSGAIVYGAISAMLALDAFTTSTALNWVGYAAVWLAVVFPVVGILSVLGTGGKLDRTQLTIAPVQLVGIALAVTYLAGVSL